MKRWPTRPFVAQREKKTCALRAGYEPKRGVKNVAVAMEDVNPFWSDRAQAEAALQNARPAGLEAAEDEEVSFDLFGEGPAEPLQLLGARTEGVLPGIEDDRVSMELGNGPTGTNDEPKEVGREPSVEPPMPPSSWMLGQWKPSGSEPSAGSGWQFRAEGSQRVGLVDGERSQGMVANGRVRERTTSHSSTHVHGRAETTGRKDELPDDLQRALEKEVVNELRRQNAELWNAYWDLKEKMDSKESSWERVSPPTMSPRNARSRPVEPPKTPKKDESMMFTPMECRTTPNGTMVPAGTPPPSDDEGVELPPFPTWPVREKSREREPCKRGIGNLDVSWQAGVRGSHGYEGSRHVNMGNQGCENAQQARMFWLEQEVEQLRSAMREHAERGPPAPGFFHGAYQPVERYPQTQLGKHVLQGVVKERTTPIPPIPPPPSVGPARGCQAVDDGEVGDGIEKLRGIPITLPKLLDVTEPRSALGAGDWLSEIQPLIADVSENAKAWWKTVMDEANRAYQVWLAAGPLEKLQVAPMVVNAEAFSRLESRVVSMLLGSLPASLKQEVIALREVTCVQIIFRVLRQYQPGGLNERAATLTSLTKTVSAKTPNEAVEGLRAWYRNLLRARELALVIPDPLLQTGALTDIMKNMLQKDPQAAFRVSSFRMMRQVDTAPTQQVVEEYLHLLIAEADLMVHQRTGGADEPKVKVMSTVACRHWGSEGGCYRGKSCTFSHDWQNVVDANQRCWVCSAKGHGSRDCPNNNKPGKGGTPKKDDEKGSKGTPKGKDKGKSGGKGKNESPGKSQSDTQTGGSKGDEKKDEKKMIPNPKMQVMTRASKRLKTALARMKTTLGFPKSWSLK